MKRKTVGKVLGNIILAIIFYLLISFSLFLGLQVDSLYGNISLVVTSMLGACYILRYTNSSTKNKDI